MWDGSCVFLLFVAHFSLKSDVIEGVTITNLKVPSSVKIGSQDSVVLDCIYDINEYEKTSLVIRWYFKNDLQPFYQWIPKHSPQVVSNKTHSINVGYKVDSDEYKAYRAVQFVNVHTNMTGAYRCQVSSFENDDEKSGTMIIYAPAQEMEINYSNLNENLLNVSCTADGVYPEPKLNIYQVSKSSKVPLDHVVETFFKGGLYRVLAYGLLEKEKLDSDVEFLCSLTIPETDYVEVKSLSIFNGQSTTMASQIGLLGSAVEERDHFDAPFVGIPTTNTLNDKSAANPACHLGIFYTILLMLILR